VNIAAIISAISGTISVATEVAKLVPDAIKLEQSVEPFAKAIFDHVVNKKVVTAADLTALKDATEQLRARLQAPLPPEDDQDV
jgi:hypothetical protein